MPSFKSIEAQAENLLESSNAIYEAIEALNAAEGDKSQHIAAVYTLMENNSREPEDVSFFEAAIKQAAGRGYANLIRDCAKRARKIITAHKRDRINSASNVTQFSTLPGGLTEQLMCGRYIVNDMGILAPDSSDSDAATYTLTAVPIVPTLIVTNIQTGIISVRLAYLAGGEWQTVTTEMRTASSRHDIVTLSAYGLGITSENAAGIVAYINVMISLNQTRIPATAGTSQLGWNEDQFMPYTSAVAYDGTDDELKRVFDSVTTGGSEDKWLEMMREIRHDTFSPIRVFIAAALAAPMLEKLGRLCSFVHMWGTSQFGKTVSLLVAASIYGNPAEGHLLHSLSSTQVGMTMLAGTLKNLPVCLDESESIKDKAGNLQNLVYTLTQGMSKSKGTKGGGMAKSFGWRTLILTNGESPLTDSDSAGGAVNRVLNIYCAKPLFDDPARVADCMRANYGWGGEKWVRFINEQGDLKPQFDQCAQRLKALSHATGKQLDIGAALLLADELAARVLFDDQPIDIGTLANCLVTMDAININRRALEAVRDWLAANQANILPYSKKDRRGFNYGEDGETGIQHIIGQWDDEKKTAIAIIPSELKRELSAHGFNYEAFLTGMDEDGRIITTSKDRANRKTCIVSIGGQNVRCVKLRLSNSDVHANSEYVQSDFEL